MNKLIYNYDRSTGAYVSTSAADPSPREPGVFLIPAHATEVAPPATQANECAVFNADGRTWSVVPDYRGRVFYSTTTGEHVEITELGKTPADLGFTDQEPPAGFVTWGGTAWQHDVERTRAAALSAIDATAGAARARYITVAPGQEATYILKAQQAAAFKAGGYSGPAPGLVQAEMDATGATAQAAADDILAQEAAWAYKAAQIESARRRGKVAAGNAADAAAVEAARAAAIAELGTL